MQSLSAYLRAIHRACTSTPAVRSLTEYELRIESSKLAEVVADSGYTPDLIVGIASGGVPIAEVVHKRFPSSKLVIVRSQRDGTEIKKRLSLSMKVLRCLPRSLNNFLRRWEFHSRVILNEQLDGPDTKTIDRKAASVQTKLQQLLPEIMAAKHVLIVDDTVDTGNTVDAVRVALLALLGTDIQVRAATITCIYVTPWASADYRLYENVLIRFHWSFDSK